jgi:hypothetical protein
MAEKEEPILVYVGLGNVKIAANQGYQNRINDIVKKFQEYFLALLCLWPRALLAPQVRRSEPVKLVELSRVLVK